jgi:hypothetical protein
MAEVKNTVLAKHKTNKNIGLREFKTVEWNKGGSWKKDWELEEETKTTAKSVPTKEAKPEESLEFVEALKSEYKELHPEGKKVPNNRVKDIEWIKEEIAKMKSDSTAEEGTIE